MTPEEILEELNYFTGSQEFYKHPFGIIYTEGIKFLADSCECYWLIDLIASYQFESKVKKEEFQVYKLKVNKNRTARVKIEDGNNHLIAYQDIEYTDFPLDKIEIWYSNSTIYLPTEH